MEAALQQLLKELEIWGLENDALAGNHQGKMLNLEPNTAHLISILIRSSKCRSLLEIGTSNGYSTIWLAWATKSTGGHIISIERDSDKQSLADVNLRRAGLRERVDLLLGDATEVVSALTGPFDFVFFDADRVSAPEQLRFLQSKLLPGALVLADNVLSHPDEIAGYLAAIEALPDFDHMIIPVGKGLSVAYRSLLQT
jgi:predicted O-methyltransferase YrrM